LIDEHKITHALIDFYIPSEHGPAIMRYLKKNNPNARIALVSSSDKPENIDEAKAAGAESCICTSWQSDEVERAFGDVLRGWLEASS
jgi:DNA-binding NarL/FixJ family response regulator